MTERAEWVVPTAVRRAIVAHARRERPIECCGFLVGEGQRVRHAVPMTNVARSRVRFTIDAAAHIALRRMLRGFAPRLDILGVYHSHPTGPARPSPADVAEAHYAEWLHVIVNLERRAALAGFRIVSGRVERARMTSDRSKARAPVRRT